MPKSSEVDRIAKFGGSCRKVRRLKFVPKSSEVEIQAEKFAVEICGEKFEG